MNTNTSPIPTSLKYFDALPDTANVRQPVVEALFACSGPTVWRWAKKGIIPAPRKIAPRVTVWNVGEIRSALKNQGDGGNVAKASMTERS